MSIVITICYIFARLLQKAVKRYERLIRDCSRLSTHSRRFVPQDDSDFKVDQDLKIMAHALFKLEGKRIPSHWAHAAKSMETHFHKSPHCSEGKSDEFAISCIKLSVHRLGSSWPSAEMNESCELIYSYSSAESNFINRNILMRPALAPFWIN